MAVAIVGTVSRAAAMAARLDRTAARLGVPEPGRRRVAMAFRMAMAPREARGLDDHHPDYLHPARTALILMDDVGLAEATVLEAAILLETRDPDLVASAEEAGPDPAAAALLAEVPRPAGERDLLLERLVAASEPVRLIALAERLDHARHLHLRPRVEWAAYHHITCGSYAPVAARTHSRLAHRYEWWCRTFSERFLAD